MNASTVDYKDLGAERGLSAATLALFNVRHDGGGWLYDTRTMDGRSATRWKSYSSTRPDGDDKWAKYRWIPEKNPAAKYCYPPSLSLKLAVADAWGTLYIVGGDIGVMTLIEAGVRSVTGTFGDGSIPDTLVSDLLALGVTRLVLIPDRDKSGEAWAVKMRDMLRSQLEIELDVRALPYPLEQKHGKDINDYWLDSPRDKARFIEALAALPAWRLPEPVVAPTLTLVPRYERGELPQTFIDAMVRHVEAQHGFTRWNADGWANYRCDLHDDTHVSAGFNRTSASFKCFVCGSKSAKDYGEAVGIKLRDFYERTESIPLTPAAPTPPLAQPTPTPAAPPLKALRPKLPASAELNDAQRALVPSGRRWLDEYLAWTRRSCPLAPEIFHEAMALWLLATVSTRRMRLRIGGQEIYPNLYVMVVAKTSLYRKSTAMNEAKKLLKHAGLECLLLPTDVTPEALFDELAGIKPANFDGLTQEDKRDWLLGRAVAAQRSFMKDECSSIFANLKKDYNAGLTELLLEGYQGDGGKLKKLLKSKGLISVKDMCLSFLGATTPVMYSKYITNEETENGFVARFAIITPEGIPVYEIVDEPVPVPGSLVTYLRRLFLDVLPWHGNERPSASGSLMADVMTPPALDVTASPDAMAQLNAYRKALNYDMLIGGTVDDGKAAAYTRLGTMALKVAMLLAAVGADEAGAVRIEAQHAYAAQAICERWRESLHRLDLDVAHSSDSTNDKVLTYLRSAGDSGASLRDIMRDCAIKQRGYLEDVLKTLHEDGKVEKFEHKPDGAGRPSVRFKALNKLN